MKKRRIFIAINLPREIKKKLSAFKENWPQLPVRWTKTENLHITLEFLGYVKDEDLPEVFKKVEKMALSQRPFAVKLNKICFGPLGFFSGQIPRMIWAVGKSSTKLGVVIHITLGRIRKWDWQRIDPEDRPEIIQDIDLNFSVNSVEVMESILKKGGPEYVVLKSFNF